MCPRCGAALTIGKFDLVYHPDAPKETKLAEFDGTMVLKTRRQRKLLEKAINGLKQKN